MAWPRRRAAAWAAERRLRLRVGLLAIAAALYALAACREARADSVVRIVTGGRTRVPLARFSNTEIAMGPPEFAALAPLQNGRCPCIYSFRIRAKGEGRFRYYVMGAQAFEGIRTAGRFAGYDAERSHDGAGVAEAEVPHALWDPEPDWDFPVLVIEHAGPPDGPALRVEYDARFETARELQAAPGWSLDLGPAVHAALFARLECPPGAARSVSLGGPASAVSCGEARLLELDAECRPGAAGWCAGEHVVAEAAGEGPPARLLLTALLVEPTLLSARTLAGGLMVLARVAGLAGPGRGPPPPSDLSALVGGRPCAVLAARALPASPGDFEVECATEAPARAYADVIVALRRARSRSSGAFALDYAGNPFAQVSGEDAGRREAERDAAEWAARGRPRPEGGLLAAGSAVVYSHESETFAAAGGAGWGARGSPERAAAEAAAANVDAQLQALQFPPSCKGRPILLFEFEKGFGLGAHIYWMAAALRVAHERNWTLAAASPNEWHYWRPCTEGYTCLFEPIGACTPADGPVVQHWRSLHMLLHAGPHSPISRFRAAVPAAAGPAARRLGFRWYKARLVRFLFRPRREVLAHAERIRAAANWTDATGPVVGLHVRKLGDKATYDRPNVLEAAGPLWEGPLHRHGFLPPPSAYARALRALAARTRPAAVFVSSDVDISGELAGLEAEAGLRLLYDRGEKRGLDLMNFEVDAVSALASMLLLSRADHLVGTFSSCFGRLALDAMHATTPDALALSVDTPWYSLP